MDKTELDQIKIKFPYFSDPEIEELLTFAAIKKYGQGHKIIHPNTIVPDDFYYVFKGLVRGFTLADGDESVNLYFIEDNHYLLAPARILEGKGVTGEHGFETVTDTLALQINYTKLLEKCALNSSFFKLYHEGLKTILGTFSERIKLMIIEDASQRFLHLSDTRPVIVEFAQKKHIAQFLGITPNSFSRILSSKIEK